MYMMLAKKGGGNSGTKYLFTTGKEPSHMRYMDFIRSCISGVDGSTHHDEAKRADGRRA